MSEPRSSPGLGAVALIAALSTVVGLALADAVLTLPVPLDRSRAAVVAFVVLCQGLVWWWSRHRRHGLVAAAYRLVAVHKGLALWALADIAFIVLLWAQGTARWSRVAPVWDAVAAYVTVRAALLALLALGTKLGGAERLPGRTVVGRGARLALLAAALAAPVWTRLPGTLPAWQGAVAGGLLALLALAACANAGAARDTWVGLAGIVASPALAIGGSALLLASPALPLAAPLALSALLLALGLATLATPAALHATDRT